MKFQCRRNMTITPDKNESQILIGQLHRIKSETRVFNATANVKRKRKLDK